VQQGTGAKPDSPLDRDGSSPLTEVGVAPSCYPNEPSRDAKQLIRAIGWLIINNKSQVIVIDVWQTVQVSTFFMSDKERFLLFTLKADIGHEGSVGLSVCKVHIYPSDHRSQATLGPVSTWMGDHPNDKYTGCG
jgi:hypothetical protein